MKHLTKDGELIDLKDLELSHLKNILRCQENMARNGFVVRYGGGVSAEDMWCDEEQLSEDEALRHLGYYSYKNELNRRKPNKIKKGCVK